MYNARNPFNKAGNSFCFRNDYTEGEKLNVKNSSLGGL